MATNYGSHEYQIHHHVSELMRLLGLSRDSGAGAQEYLLMLMKSITPYISTQISTHGAKRKIAENSPTPMEFLQKYEDLKNKNVRDLDALVSLLSKLSDDDQTKQYLQANADRRLAQAAGEPSILVQGSSQLPPPKLTGEELEKLRAQLTKATTEPARGPSDAMRKILREQHLARNIDFPETPDWLINRSFLSLDFVADVIPRSQEALPLDSLPLPVQERMMLEDLLFCLEGIDGKYITAKPVSSEFEPREFDIEETIDPGIKHLTRRILPLSSNYSIVVRFIEEKSLVEFGLVNQALAAAMNEMIQDYLLLIAQLEEQYKKGDLLLEKLLSVLGPTMHSMATMASIATTITKSEAFGGTVLTILHETTNGLTGDPAAQKLALFVTQRACVPYFDILQKWIYKGLIVDPYGEFLIEENKTFEREKMVEDYNDAYWEQHCVIIPAKVPVFLEKCVEKILNTGKYLNVVRQCGQNVSCPTAVELIYDMQERKLLEPIDKAYSYASRLLLDLLMEERDLMQRFRSVKHYFLLDQGDFIVQFLDMAEEEMRLPMEEIIAGRLESLLELALRCSTTNADPYKDDVRVELLPYDLITQLFKVISIETKHEKDYRIDPTDLHLSGLEAFSFDYVVKWPLSLVLNRKVLTRYQMLFRHLFYCKHVERQLCNVWRTNKSSKRNILQTSRWHAAGFALRQRMLNFVQNLEYFMMFEVIEPQWHVFMNKLRSVENMDEVLTYQTDFLDSCLKDCMLTNPDLLKTLHKLMMICVTFSNFVQRVSQSASVEYEVSRLASATLQAAPTTKQRREEPQEKAAMAKVVTEHVDQLTSSENFEKTILKFDQNFTRHLVGLLEQIKQQSSSAGEHKLINIVYRLDFNGFYGQNPVGSAGH